VQSIFIITNTATQLQLKLTSNIIIDIFSVPCLAKV